MAPMMWVNWGQSDGGERQERQFTRSPLPDHRSFQSFFSPMRCLAVRPGCKLLHISFQWNLSYRTDNDARGSSSAMPLTCSGLSSRS
jgi:hypothetical protein